MRETESAVVMKAERDDTVTRTRMSARTRPVRTVGPVSRPSSRVATPAPVWRRTRGLSARRRKSRPALTSPASTAAVCPEPTPPAPTSTAATVTRDTRDSTVRARSTTATN